MKKIQLILLILVLSGASVFAQTTKKRRIIKPKNFQKRVSTVISEKTRYYYSLNDKKASVISVEGPGVLRVLTRGRFIPKQGNTIKYEVVYSIDGGEIEKFKASGVKRSKSATYLNGNLGVPGQLEDFEIKLGRGYHTIEFKLKDKSIPVAVRYMFTKTKVKKQEWIAYSPKQPSEPVDLITRESTINYYRFSTDKPMVIEINGPTELRVMTRTENHFQMKGRIHYRLQLKEKGKILNTFQLSSRPSEITVYKDEEELVPGKAREFVIIVPKGRHHYELIPLDKDKSTLLGRLLIPKRDVKLVD